MQLDEEALHVAVEATLAHLVGDRLDEGVVPPFRARAELERAERPAEGAGAGGGGDGGQAELGKEAIRLDEDVGGRGVTAKEVTHLRECLPAPEARPASTPSSRAAWLNRCGIGCRRPTGRRSRNSAWPSRRPPAAP